MPRQSLIFVFVMLIWGCAAQDGAGPGFEDEFEEAFIEGRPPLSEGKGDEFTLRWQRLDGFEIPAGALEVETRRVVTSAAAFERFFGQPAPEQVDFNEQWVVFFTAGKSNLGVVEDFESLRYADSMKSLRIMTRVTVLDETCPEEMSMRAPEGVLATFARPPIRPQSVRYYHLERRAPCGTTCIESLRAEFELATEDLWYPSESDYLFEFVHFPGVSAVSEVGPELLAEAVALDVQEPYEVREMDGFFEWLGRPESDDMDDWEREEASRYRALKGLIGERLEDVRIFRLAQIEVQVFILGLSSCRSVVGLRTVSIET